MIESPGFFNESDLDELRNVFFAQTFEILEQLQDALLRLEEQPEDTEAIKVIKRFVHTLKGDANSMGMADIGTLCHRVEDLLKSKFGDDGSADPTVIELLFNAVDLIQQIVQELEQGVTPSRIDGMLGRIAMCLGDYSMPQRDAEADGTAVSQEFPAAKIEAAIKSGRAVFAVEVRFHPMCRERSIGAAMVRGRLSDIGQVLSAVPEQDDPAIESADRVTYVLATLKEKAAVASHAGIVGITDGVNVVPHANESPVAPAHGNGGPQRNGNEILRIEAFKVDRVMNLVGELIISRSMIDQLARDSEATGSSGDLSKRLVSANSYMSRTVSDLQRWVMKMRMVPVSQVFRKFPKIVRDLSTEKGKPLRTAIHGKETELDKGIVDRLGEPLSHLVRNAVDHGIESAPERAALGKPAEALVTLRAYHEASRIVIEVSDDGRGIDAQKLKSRAVKQGYLPAEEAERLSDQEALRLIFISGLSTSDSVTETSGRGVGMDAVKAGIDAMKGTIEVESTPSVGTTFRIRVPLTLAVIKALLVEVGGRHYAIPIAMVSEVARIADVDIITMDGRETLMLRKRIISIIRLSDLFGLTQGPEKEQTMVILNEGKSSIGLLVDRITTQQELVIKAIDHDGARSDLVSGASILGNGKVVLFLDAAAVFRKAVEQEKNRMAGALP